MKPKQQEKTKNATYQPTQGHWQQMNRKQRREMTRKIQSEDISLEMIHPDAAGIDICNESHYVAVLAGTGQPTDTASSAFLERPEEEVSMVWAFQSEFGRRAEKLWHAMKDANIPNTSERMGSYNSSTPSEMCPLQAADVFAYELLKEFDNRLKRPQDKMRYGLRRIVTPFGPTRLF